MVGEAFGHAPACIPPGHTACATHGPAFPLVQVALRRRLKWPERTWSTDSDQQIQIRCTPFQPPPSGEALHRNDQDSDCSDSGSHTGCDNVEGVAGLTRTQLEGEDGTTRRHFADEEAERKRDLRSTQAGDARCGVGTLFAGHCTAFCA